MNAWMDGQMNEGTNDIQKIFQSSWALSCILVQHLVTNNTSSLCQQSSSSWVFHMSTNTLPIVRFLKPGTCDLHRWDGGLGG